MAAGLGFKTFTSGEVLTAADTNGYLMQGILVFANASARTAAVTSPQEGQYSYLKDTNALEYYDGAAWVGAPVGDITAVTAGTGISGGGSSGDVTITNSMATTIDAKGDLIAGTADNTFARLAVGNNGETLVADSAATTGLRYTAGTVQSNPVLNSAMQNWQRGTSISVSASTSPYTADRWQVSVGASNASTVSRQATGDTTNLPFIQYAMRFQRNASQTGTTGLLAYQSFESINSIPFAGKTVTYSFYARKGANYSPTSSLLAANLFSGTGTDQNIFGTYTGIAAVASTSATLTTTWQRFTVSGTVSSSATELAIGFEATPTGTAGAADYFEVTGVQLDIGSVALPFRTYAGTIQGELAACQRYYFRFTTAANQCIIPFAYASSSVYANAQLQFPVPMRIAPTSLDSANLQFVNYSGSGYGMTSVAFNEQSATACQIYGSITGATAGHAGKVNGTASTSYVGLSAEL